MLSLFSATSAFSGSGSDLVSKFDEWKRSHGKSYATAEAEAAAVAAFAHNDALIDGHNAKKLSFWLGHNEFSDLTFEEFQRKHMAGGMALFTNRAPKNVERVHLTGRNGGGAPPDAIDWVAKGAVTPVKNQGQCGSCWSFSTTGSIEGSWALQTGSLTSLSEQELVSCDNAAHGGEDQGCAGGLMDNAFEWLESRGLCTEAAYPYTAGTGIGGQCQQACTPVVSVAKFTDVPKGDEIALKSAVAQQPVSIAVDASGSQWQLYKGGVFDHAMCGKQLDHGVLLVGYGTDKGLFSKKDYWKIKNSWGATWGLDGYMHMVAGKNMCGLANSASYPKAKAFNATAAAAAAAAQQQQQQQAVAPAAPRGAGGAGAAHPPPVDQTHYGDPKGGCLPDETETTIQGVRGDFCTPKCTLFRPCPTDVPPGVSARPQCALEDAKTAQKYCALICSTRLPIADQAAADKQCGANASCKPVQAGIGLCTYDD
eukprot:Transcript_6532.p1 GENE.Transcript_6532~~Transcript_6532.p1  ORF type:complete len:481 (-),score=199.92 Transcript_6532:244-1686(-)